MPIGAGAAGAAGSAVIDSALIVVLLLVGRGLRAAEERHGQPVGLRALVGFVLLLEDLQQEVRNALGRCSRQAKARGGDDSAPFGGRVLAKLDGPGKERAPQVVGS